MSRLRPAYYLLVLIPALVFGAVGIAVAHRSRADLQPELDRHAAARGAEFLRWERSHLRQRLVQSVGSLSEVASDLSIERFTFYERDAVLDREVFVGTFPVDSPIVPLTPETERSEPLRAAARRGAAAVDLVSLEGRVRWLAYQPDGERTTVALLALDPGLSERFRAASGYELAFYYEDTRVPPAWIDWPENLPAALLDSLASFDRAISARLAGQRAAAAPIKDFDDWDVIGAALVRPGASAPATPGFPPIPALALVLAALATAGLLWRAAPEATRPRGARSLRQRLARALVPAALAAAWLVALDARASSRATDATLEISARLLRGVLGPTAPHSAATISANELARLSGFDVVVLHGDSIAAATRETPSAALAGLESPAGRLRLGADRRAYRQLDLSQGWRLFLLAPPLEDSRKAVLFWLAGLYALLAVGALIFVSHASAAGSALELREAATGWAFIGPSLALLLVFSAAPLLFAFYLSFHGWNLVEPAKPFVGLRHYVQLAGDGLFWNAAKNTLIYSLYVPATMVLSLAVALLLNRSFRGVALLRAVFFMPYITSFVAISIVWQWMYDPEFGLFNWALGLVGLGPYPWLSNPATALPALMILAVWIHIGFQMVIFLAGLQAIPSELYEAAMIDGAGRWRRFWRITVPLLKPTTFFVLVTSAIGSFQVFTFVYVMTEGGPLRATDVIVYHIYQNAWQFLRMGYASAMSWVLFAAIFAITLLQFKLLGRRITPYG